MLKYPGSKASYSEWIVSHFPAHRFYLEPYFGSGSVFFQKSPAKYETINDVDGLVVNFFKACRDYPEELARQVYLTPFSRDEYMGVQEEKAGQDIKLTGDCVEDARRFLIRCAQGFGSKLADRVGWKNTKQSKGPVNPVVWNRLPDFIINASIRLKNAQIENTEAVTLIEQCNKQDVLVYADPPYMGCLRSNKRIYRHEMMDDADHEKLLKVLQKFTGFVVISGYENDLYNDVLSNWSKAYKNGHANSGGKRTEVIWMNFDEQVQMNIGEL